MAAIAWSRWAPRRASSFRSCPASCWPTSRPSGPGDDDRPALKLTDARVELRDVSFAYRLNEPVLNRMSFVAEPGKVTALVGPSGGGKSTVLALLLRFYEATGGDILIDGQSISRVSRTSLRRETAYVGQAAYLC